MESSASRQLSDCVALAESMAISSVHMFNVVWATGSKVQWKHIGLRSVSKPTFPNPFLSELMLWGFSPFQGSPSATSFCCIAPMCEEGFCFSKEREKIRHSYNCVTRGAVSW